jgi:hypothetical protein
VVGAAELLLVEVDLKFLDELFAVPVEELHELLVIGALLVPIGEQ